MTMPTPLPAQLTAEVRRLLVEALIADLKAHPTVRASSLARACPDGGPTVAGATVREGGRVDRLVEIWKETGAPPDAT